MQTLLAEAEARSEHGGGYPAHVKREFERYLSCGQLAGGFTRLACRSCGQQRLIPTSCKARSVCPSCVARRMADTALHLTEHVMPDVPYRQWTLSLPYALRLQVVSEPKVLSDVVSIFLRCIFAWQRHRARRAGVREPLCGSVTLLQLWGSYLQLTPHAHAWLPDGVFAPQDDGTLTFVALPPPVDGDIDTLVRRVGRRICKRLSEDDATEPDDAIAAVMLEHRAEAVTLPIPAAVRSELAPSKPLNAAADGFSLNANLVAPQHDEKTLQHLVRYGLRPPLAQKRLSWTAEGKVRLKLRKPSATGRTSIVFEPVEFLRRLAAAIPRPRQNLIRFHGCFAANHKCRPDVVALAPAAKRAARANHERPADSTDTPELMVKRDPDAIAQSAGCDGSVPRPYRRRWADLLKHIFDHDVLVCDRCAGRMVPVQTVDSPAVIARILTHLGLPATLPQPASARAPPQQTSWEFDPDFDDAFDHTG